MVKLGAKELRITIPEKEQVQSISKHPIYIILDDVMDTYNIGAIFRLADAVSAKKVFLCGETETPPNSRIKTASINTIEWVAWDYYDNVKTAIDKLRIEEPFIKIFSIEQDERSIPYGSVDYTFPVALIVGHETRGVSEDALLFSDEIIEIPMWGVNKSLNVMVSLGIVLYEVMEKAVK